MKKNNKGFSLVELIIVIAIMAILIGVLAPQYIKYVEKSRKSADEDTADSLKNACMTACTDDDYYLGISDGNTAVFDKNGIDASGDSLNAALNEFFVGWKSNKVKSKVYQNSKYVVKFTADSTTGGLKAIGSWQ